MASKSNSAANHHDTMSLKRSNEVVEACMAKRPLTSVGRNAMWLIRSEGMRDGSLSTPDSVLLCLLALLSLARHGVLLAGDAGLRIARCLLLPGHSVSYSALWMLRREGHPSLQLPYGLLSVPQYFDKSSRRALTMLRSVFIPDSVRFLSRFAFASCNFLTQVRMPAALTAMGDFCFSNCKKLRTMRVPNGVKGLHDSNFFMCYALRECLLPATLTTLGDDVFSGCVSLTKVELPPRLTSIGQRCFFESGLRQITIPASVDHIGDEAFSGCLDLVAVHFEGPTRVGDNVFDDCHSDIVISRTPSIATKYRMKIRKFYS